MKQKLKSMNINPLFAMHKKDHPTTKGKGPIHMA